MGIKALPNSTPAAAPELHPIERRVSPSAPGSAQATPVPQNASTPSTPDNPTQNEQLKRAVDTLRRSLDPNGRQLQFSVEEQTHQVVVRVIDAKTKEVIRQIPSEEAIRLARAALESGRAGILTPQKA